MRVLPVLTIVAWELRHCNGLRKGQMHVDQMSQPFLGLSSWSCSVRCGNSNSQISWVQVARHIPQDSLTEWAEITFLHPLHRTSRRGKPGHQYSCQAHHIWLAEPLTVTDAGVVKHGIRGVSLVIFRNWDLAEFSCLIRGLWPVHYVLFLP